MSQIILYTDGACSGNPWPGWWGVVILLQHQPHEWSIHDLVTSPPKRTIHHEDGSTTYEYHIQWTLSFTTNNQMELQAAIEWIKRILRYYRIPLPIVSAPSQFSGFDFDISWSSDNSSTNSDPSPLKPSITIVSDSLYVKQGIQEWITIRRNNARRSSTNKRIANIDQWHELDTLWSCVEWSWKRVKWHNGNHYNELADQLASGKL